MINKTNKESDNKNSNDNNNNEGTQNVINHNFYGLRTFRRLLFTEMEKTKPGNIRLQGKWLSSKSSWRMTINCDYIPTSLVYEQDNLVYPRVQVQSNRIEFTRDLEGEAAGYWERAVFMLSQHRNNTFTLFLEENTEKGDQEEWEHGLPITVDIIHL